LSRADLAVAANGFVIVEDGQAKTSIRIEAGGGPRLHGDEPGEEAAELPGLAAGRLAHYLQRVSGAKVPIVYEPGPGIKLAIAPALRSTLTEDGYVIHVDTEGIRLAGASPLATIYAVYTLLEEHGGCRWFMPGPIGEDLPATSAIAVPFGEKRYRPAFRFRSIDRVGDQEWALQSRLSESVHVGRQGYAKVWGIAHTYDQLLPPEKYFHDHPDWFPLIDGKRQGPMADPKHGPDLCTSNPEVVGEVARRINELFDKDPRLEMVTLGPNDGGNFCQCKNCQTQDEPGKEWRGAEHRLPWRGQLSRRIMLFNNAVARLVREKHPDKMVKVMMYWWYQEAPSDPGLRFEDNICVMLTHSGNPSNVESIWPSCYNHPLDDPRCRPNQERFVPALKSWRQRSRQLGIYEYYAKGSVCQTLFPIVHTIRKDVPFYHSQGATYFHTQGSAGLGVVGFLNLYVTSRLMWDVDAEVDKLLADFYQRFYREAHEPMQAYHELLERRMSERGGDVLGWLFHLPKVYDEQTAHELKRLCDQARQQARSDLVRERIAQARMELDYTLLATELWQELERGYAELKPPDGSWPQDRSQRLAARIRPHQDALRAFCEAHEPLQRVARLKDEDGYTGTLLNPRLARVYPRLLPGSTTAPASAPSRNDGPAGE